MTVGFQKQLQRISVVLVVIDDEDAWKLRIHDGLEFRWFDRVTFFAQK
jgi:hypothetical protein